MALNLQSNRRRHKDPLWVHGVLMLVSIPFVLPFIWMVATSLKTPAQFYGRPYDLLPNPITLQNYVDAWQISHFSRYISNTLIIVVIGMIGALFSSSLAGFAFAILTGRGKRLLFALVIAALLVPSFVRLIPLFWFFSRVGWTNTFLPLIVPNFFGVAFYIFLFRQFFTTIPAEIFDSAQLDGCTPLQAYWHIALPLSKPIIAITLLFSFIGGWNELLEALVYLNSQSLFTVSLGLSLFQGVYVTRLEYLMPLSTLSLIPIFVMFLLAHRYLSQSILADNV